MHFCGPDQLHGFEERLTTDIYPADFGWTPDYRKPGERIDWWYHNMTSPKQAGIAQITNQLEYDDEVAFQAMRKIYDGYKYGEVPHGHFNPLTIINSYIDKSRVPSPEARLYSS